jgi:hypothetical protein
LDQLSDLSNSNRYKLTDNPAECPGGLFIPQKVESDLQLPLVLMPMQLNLLNKFTKVEAALGF